MKYLIPALLASALILPAAAMADEATHHDRAEIHHTNRAIHHEQRAEHRALRHGDVHRAAHEQRKINEHKVDRHVEHHELHQDRVGE